jgi:hypothetical protein
MGMERAIATKTLIHIKPVNNNQLTQYPTKKSRTKSDIQRSINQIERLITRQASQQTQLPLT